MREIKTTLNKIRSHQPCADGWEKLLKKLGKTKADDDPLDLLTILKSNGLDDALWCFRAVDGHDRDMRLFGVWCAQQVQHLMTDQRSIDALDAAERFANGKATIKELNTAWDAAWSTAWATAGDAAWAARDAAGAAGTAKDAAMTAARAAQEKHLRKILKECK